jgi:putative ABC transport system permease protein
VALKPGVDPDQVARELRAVLPNDTQIFTRPELSSHEVSFWTTRTGTGLIFGSGLVVAFVVGIMVLFQTLATGGGTDEVVLATQITRQLPQFATLKAIGYSSAFLNAIVLIEAVLVMVIAFVPALAAAIGIYSVIRVQTLLPVNMTAALLGGVFATTLLMSGISAFLSLGRLRRADPAEIF